MQNFKRLHYRRLQHRDSASSKSQGGQEPKNTLKLTLKTGKLHFIAFLHYNFEKSGGSADLKLKIARLYMTVILHNTAILRPSRLQDFRDCKNLQNYMIFKSTGITRLKYFIRLQTI